MSRLKITSEVTQWKKRAKLIMKSKSVWCLKVVHQYRTLQCCLTSYGDYLPGKKKRYSDLKSSFPVKGSSLTQTSMCLPKAKLGFTFCISRTTKHEVHPAPIEGHCFYLSAKPHPRIFLLWKPQSHTTTQPSRAKTCCIHIHYVANYSKDGR